MVENQTFIQYLTQFALSVLGLNMDSIFMPNNIDSLIFCYQGSHKKYIG